jgi:hypothetical protein
MGVVRGSGYANDPLLGKPLKLTVKIRYTEKIYAIHHENPVFLRKRTTPFKIMATPFTELNNVLHNT